MDAVVFLEDIYIILNDADLQFHAELKYFLFQNLQDYYINLIGIIGSYFEGISLTQKSLFRQNVYLGINKNSFYQNF